MATITQLKTRLALMLNRDDTGSGGALEQALIDSYTAAIDEHANELFWFNRTSGTKATVAATATIALPTGMRIAQSISYEQVYLKKCQREDIQQSTLTGRPTAWAESDGAILLYPIPDAIYTLSLYGIADLGVPASTNEWTTEAYELIANSAAKRMCMQYLRDPEGAAIYKLAEADALSQLRAETRKRGGTLLATDVPPARHSFNINLG